MTVKRLSSPVPVLLLLSVAGCSDRHPAATVLEHPSTPHFAAEPVTTRGSAPLSFTLEPGHCGLTTTVDATGELRFVLQTTRRPDGRFNPSSLHVTVHGTAVGEDGSSYQFMHMNNQRVQDFSGRDSLPFTVTGVDAFHLLGEGDAPKGHFFVHYTIRIEEDLSFTFLEVDFRGDPSCDQD